MLARGKPYLEWMERVPFSAGYKRPNIPIVKETSPAKQHLWHFTIWTSGLLENDAQRVRLFTSTLERLAFD